MSFNAFDFIDSNVARRFVNSYLATAGTRFVANQTPTNAWTYIKALGLARMIPATPGVYDYFYNLAFDLAGPAFSQALDEPLAEDFAGIVDTFVSNYGSEDPYVWAEASQDIRMDMFELHVAYDWLVENVVDPGTYPPALVAKINNLGTKGIKFRTQILAHRDMFDAAESTERILIGLSNPDLITNAYYMLTDPPA